MKTTGFNANYELVEREVIPCKRKKVTVCDIEAPHGTGVNMQNEVIFRQIEFVPNKNPAPSILDLIRARSKAGRKIASESSDEI